MATQKDMADYISTFFGKAGLDVQVGDAVIECEAPDGVSEWVSENGVTVRVGDVVQTRSREGANLDEWSEPVLVTAIFVEDGVAELRVQMPDDPERLVCLWIPWSMKGPGWYHEVQQVSAEGYEVYWSQKRTLEPGWHDLTTSAMAGQGRVHIGKDGMPTMVERFRTDFGMETVVKVAEILTGYDLKIEARYCDNDKTQRRVKSATRRQPPKVGA